ncbi:hypothetical protein EH223_08915 [candidate division KSB1 bacterium]|nr:TMF family protein [candidate division KSB1 bacterium]RQW03842.1 MAG: hypothetical protein EH223_08915 [candidate division KSB1 bacterium]
MAQSTETTTDSTRQKIKNLEKSVHDLLEKLEKQEQEDELKKLLEEARKLKAVEKKEEDGVGKKFHTGVRQQSALNPNISVSGDFFAGLSSSGADFINDESERSYGNNGFFLRELELSLLAPLDPFTRGKSFLSVTEESISIEEAYMEWLNLPLAMNLKVGLFNAEFGILNRYHDHALPQFDRPKVLVNYFSVAYLGGFGLAGNFLLPRLLWADASMFDLAVLNGGNGISFTNEKRSVLAVANFTNFYDITHNTFFEWRLGAVTGYNDAELNRQSVVGNISANLKWIPSDRAKYRTFDWKTEFLYSVRDEPSGSKRSKGFYTSIQNKLNARWWLTGRIDYTELPYDNNQNEWAYTIGADFWQSEFVFLRCQYQYSKRNYVDIQDYDGPYPDDHSLIMQVNWAMGPHKHEAY